MSAQTNGPIRREIDHLVQQGILTPSQGQKLAARYPSTPWDVVSLIRWFTILGAVTAGVGVVLLARELVSAERLGELGLALATGGLIFLGRHVAGHKGLVKTGAALELVAGFALQGVTALLALDFSTGSDNWPALVGVQTVLLTVLAYLLQNRLVLVHAGVCFFVFFGGSTGYVSGWGVYWLGMNYPLRFLVAGLGFLAVAWLHAVRLQGALAAFSRVYAHLGLLVLHLSLWFLALFGYFEKHVRFSGNAGERIGFSLLWAVISVACVALSGALGQRVLRAYGLTFLIINAYTFYFQFVVAHSAEAWFVHLLLFGGSLVAVGFYLERQFRHRQDDPQAPVL